MMDSRKIQEDIIGLARTDPKLALERANALVKELPREAWTWSIRSHVHETKNDFQNAISDINRALKLNFNEPANHFHKAKIFIDLKDYNESISSFSNAIDVSENNNFPYYIQICHFMRAFCYCKLGEFEAAECDLQYVGDDMQAWIDRLRSKAELLEACRNRQLD
jgi:tetratricopeptide (TPR) repeat protein